MFHFLEGLGGGLGGGWDRPGYVNTCAPAAISGQETFVGTDSDSVH